MIKTAIVGAGLWANEHARIYKEMKDVECVAICDINAQRANEFAQRNGIPEVYTSHKEMLAKSGCDAVSIVTPDFLHTEIAVDCANAGRHMLIEKPLATTIIRALPMRASATISTDCRPERSSLSPLRIAQIPS